MCEKDGSKAKAPPALMASMCLIMGEKTEKCPKNKQQRHIPAGLKATP